jgi:beta-mannosidase
MRVILILLASLVTTLQGQVLPRKITPYNWELSTFLPGPANAIRYQGAWQKVPLSRSINELIDLGYTFKDSAGQAIKSNQVEYNYWKYRAKLSRGSTLKQWRNICLLAEKPEPYSVYLVDGNPVSMSVSNNMDVWKAMSTRRLNDTGSVLEVQLSGLFDAGAAELSQTGFSKWPADNDTAQFKTAVVLRKPPVQFGWDVAPRRVLNGLGAGISIVPFDHAIVVDDWIRPVFITPQLARMRVRWLVYADSAASTRFTAFWNGKKVVDTTVEVDAGQNEVMAEFEVVNPVLWNPRKLSKLASENKIPYLYRFEQWAISGRDTFHKIRPVGLKTIELKQNIDLRGREFRFAVNGENLFIRGANLLPEYGFGGEAMKNRLWAGPNGLLKQLASSGYNMVRIWGGGGLMDDDFYDLCDSLGILVWQDLMYSGTTYPYEGSWKRKTLAEALAVAQKLRNHACLALYCGNNEIDIALQFWGWKEKYGWTEADSAKMAESYLKMFTREIKMVLSEADENTPYLHSSPISNWAPTDEMRYGDNHLWYVWHGERPVSDLDRIVPRFASEYGLPSWPSYATVKKHFGSDKPADRMLSYKGLRLLEKYMIDEFGPLPEDTQAIILLSQFLQARTLVRAAKAHMKDTTCGGTLYWQLNDIWPGITWSTVDFEGNKKAAWFAMKSIYRGMPGWIDPYNDPKKLVKPEWKISRKKNKLTIKVRKDAMGIMILKDGALLDIPMNVLDLPAGASVDIVLPDNCGAVEVTSIWHLMNGQGFIKK